MSDDNLFGEITEQEALAAVRNRGMALKKVPEKLRTAEVCREAVKQNALALRYVPENLKTQELCLEAVKSDGLALAYVPKALRKEVTRALKNGHASLAACAVPS